MSTPKSAVPTITETIKATIAARGLNSNEVARLSGVSQPQVYRFLHGQRDLKSKAIDAIAAALGLVLVEYQAAAVNASTR